MEARAGLHRAGLHRLRRLQAAAQSDGPVRSVHLRCDPRIYKNCYAVGIPHSGHKVGILWALAIGSLLPDPAAKLEVFRQIDAGILAEAGRPPRGERGDGGGGPLSAAAHGGLLGDPDRAGRAARCIERDHTRLVRLEKNGKPAPIRGAGRAGGALRRRRRARRIPMREALAKLSFEDLLAIARSITPRTGRPCATAPR